jgi:C-terminal processing protease CtpA/Prc
MRKYKLLKLGSILLLALVGLFHIKNNKDTLESSFKQTLFDIQQNSIKNFEWKELDWQHYHNKQIKRLPIFTKKYFYDCIEAALKDLHDNHSILIKKHKGSAVTLNESVEKFSINIDVGIGIINIPTLITEVNKFDTILHEDWVVEVNNKIECTAAKVTDGWIIDLTRNAGGNMFPMLAALSYFYSEPNLGGFYSVIENKPEKTLLSFDGKSFKFNMQNLSYKAIFKTNQNNLPVVVLIGKNTASSAEFLALALKRQKHIIIIGQESLGLATGNEVMQLPHDLGNYMLTAAYFLDINNEPLIEKKVKPSIILGNNVNMISEATKLILTQK